MLRHINVFTNISWSTSVAQKKVKMAYGAIWAIIESKAYHILLQAHPELDLVGGNTPMHNVFCSSPWTLHRNDKILKKCDMITIFCVCISCQIPFQCHVNFFNLDLICPCIEGRGETLSDNVIHYLLQTGYCLGGIGWGNTFSRPIIT